VITGVKRQISKRSGAEFARLTVEDFSGSSEVLVFPEAWTLLGDRIRTDEPVLLKGGYSKRDQGVENPTFIVESVTPFNDLRQNGNVAVSIELKAGSKLSPEVMQDVRAMIEMHPGSAPLELRWSDGNGTTARFRSRTLKIAATSTVLDDLRALLGHERVRLVRGS
jgi:DNA polymerase III subunit alpha